MRASLVQNKKPPRDYLGRLIVAQSVIEDLASISIIYETNCHVRFCRASVLTGLVHSSIPLFRIYRESALSDPSEFKSKSIGLLKPPQTNGMATGKIAAIEIIITPMFDGTSMEQTDNLIRSCLHYK